MLDIYWLLRVCLRTIEHGDRTGSLFAFMPEFYLSVAINSYSALKNYFGPVHSMEELPGDKAIQARGGQKGAIGVSPSSPVLSPHGPVAHIHGGRRGGSSCSPGPCIRQVFAKAPHHGGSCPGTSSHRANSSSLVLGRKETKWSVGWRPLQLSLSSWCLCGLGAGQPHLMALALASWPQDVSAPGSLACAPLQITMGVVLCGGRRQELGLLTDC